jgi:DNA-binding beta-propeller fold protein YncE
VGRDGILYVLDAGNFRVQAFAADGTFLRTFGSVGSGAANFARPRGIAVDDEGNVYVSDAYFGNVQIFNAQGQLLLALGQAGDRDAPGRYGLVSGVAVDETGRVYVGDQLFRKIEVIRRLAPAEQVLP